MHDKDPSEFTGHLQIIADRLLVEPILTTASIWELRGVTLWRLGDETGFHLSVEEVEKLASFVERARQIEQRFNPRDA